MPKTESNSAAETDQPQVPQYVQYAPPYAQPFEDDTIDLYELWITLWSKRWLVIGVTAVAAIGSVVFALLQPPVYKAEALLLPPKAKDIQSNGDTKWQEERLQIFVGVVKLPGRQHD